MTYIGHSVRSTLIRAYFSPQHITGSKYIYSGSNDGKIFVWNVLTGEVEKVINAHETTIRDLSWHPYEPVIASTSWDTKVKRWTVEPGKEEPEPIRPSRRAYFWD